MTNLAQTAVQRLARFVLVTQDASRLCRFYQQAMGFRRLASGRHSESGAGAERITLVVGREFVEMLQFDLPGRLYPEAASASDLCFQHFAIVVADIEQAYRRLCGVDGWRAISTAGPQRLPASSGGVSAFKFRDPDGHPLELLAFPDGKSPAPWRPGLNRELFLGIDHSAIAVSDSARSIAFYEALGLRVAARSLNSGCEQANLDGVGHPQVEVTALAPRRATPHVELLCYRSAAHDAKAALRGNDVAATRLIFEVDRHCLENRPSRQALIDPDGHHLVLVAPSTVSARFGVNP
jgi:catechol 2,3-dioxygenase-like lactoylglutathione lyase family enzyme